MSSRTEVVTRALVRDTLVPVAGHDAVRVALVTLTNGMDRRPTTFGRGGLMAIERTLAALRERDDLDAVAITGGPGGFAAGADLALFDEARTEAEARALAHHGQRAFGHLADLEVPTFAFLNGTALGGGLEIALHCDHRTVSAVATRIALPEVALGIVPAWGGSWLLPQLIGPERAVTVLVENPLAGRRTLDAAATRDLGIADVLLDPADFLTSSLRWTADLVRGRHTVERPEVRHDAGAWTAAITRGRAVVAARTHGAAPAADRALDLLEHTRERTRDQGFTAEAEAFAELLPSPEARASLYAFDLVDNYARRGAGRPDPTLARPIARVGVVGAGLMARQLVVEIASRLLVPVVMIDKSDVGASAALTAVGDEIDVLREHGVLSGDKANRVRASITGGTRWELLADCDLVIEAVTEDLEIKHAVYSALEDVVRVDCVLATNTSALSISAIAERCVHPERVTGMHFFNPVASMSLVEVAIAPTTDDHTIATLMTVVAALGKTTVLCGDSPGFVVNRLLNAFIDAAVSAVDDGTPPQDVEDAILALGVPMGPFRLLELVGPAVALHVSETMAAAFPDRFSVPTALRTLVASDSTTLTVRPHGGGRGRRIIDPTVTNLLLHPGDPLTPAEVRDRALRAVAAEVLDLLRTHVVSDHRDLDLCLLLGAGWPAHLGGITPDLRRRGLLPS